MISIQNKSICQQLIGIFELAASSDATLNDILKEAERLPKVLSLVKRQDPIRNLDPSSAREEIQKRVSRAALHLFRNLSSEDQAFIRNSCVKNFFISANSSTSAEAESSRAASKRKREEGPQNEGLSQKRIRLLSPSGSRQTVFQPNIDHKMSALGLLSQIQELYDAKYSAYAKALELWVKDNTIESETIESEEDETKNRLINLLFYFGVHASEVLVLTDFDYLEKFPEISVRNQEKVKILEMTGTLLEEFPVGIAPFWSLEFLNLRNNKFLEFPYFIANSKNLKEINLFGNKIQSIPDWIGNFSELRQLNLGTTFECYAEDLFRQEVNAVGSLPGSIGQLAKLEILNLSFNAISELPSNIGQLVSLKRLDLQSNRIHELPSEITQLSELELLDLRDNGLSGLPHLIGNLASLRFLRLGNRNFNPNDDEVSFIRLNSIETMPDSIGSLTKLEELDLSSNRLQSLPESIGGLTSLKRLNLRGNPLTNLPHSIFSLPVTCEVYIDRANFPLAVFEAIRSTVNSAAYQGPRFHFSMIEPQPLEGNIRSLNELLDGLIAASHLSPRHWPGLLAESEQNLRSLRGWLARLSLMADYRSGPDKQQAVASKIVHYLDLAENDLAFRESFFQTIQNAAATCGDRMSVSILQVGVQHRLSQIDKSDLKQFSNFLLKTVWSLDLLTTIAEQKMKELNLLDEIEVYLAYPIQLRERLSLEIDVDGMLYFAASSVTQKNLDDAFEFVQMQQTSLEARCAFLISRDDWKEALEKAYPAESAQIRALEEDDIGEVEDREIDWAQISEIREKRWRDLTAKALES